MSAFVYTVPYACGVVLGCSTMQQGVCCTRHQNFWKVSCDNGITYPLCQCAGAGSVTLAPLSIDMGVTALQ